MLKNKNNITNLERNFPLSNFSLDYLYKMTQSKVEDSSTGQAYYINDAGEIVTVLAENPLCFDGGFWNIGSWKQMCSNPLSPDNWVISSVSKLLTGIVFGSFTEVKITNLSHTYDRMYFYRSVDSTNPTGPQYVEVLYKIGDSNEVQVNFTDVTDSYKACSAMYSGGVWTLTQNAGTLVIERDTEIFPDSTISLAQFKITWNHPANSLTIGIGSNVVGKSIYVYGASVNELGYIWPFYGSGLATTASRAGTISAPMEVGDKLYSLLDGDKSFKLTTNLIPYFNHSDLPVSTTKSILHSSTQSILQFRTDASGNGYIDLKDGTNTASVALNWEYGVPYDIKMLFGYNVAESTDKMQLIVDSTASTLTAFDGSLDPDTELTIGYNNDYMLKITPPKAYALKQNNWIANPNGYLFSIVESLVVSGTLSTSGPVTIDWGDSNTNTYNGVDVGYSHTYSSIGLYHVTTQQKDAITKLAMSRVDCKLVGNAADFPVNLVTLSLYNTQSVITGNAADFPVNLVTLSLGNTQSVITGNAADFPVNLTYLHFGSTQSVINAYNSRSWGSNMRYFYLYAVTPGGLDSTEVDNLLIDLAATTWTTDKKVYILGTNAGRTSASDAAVATLISKGVSVTTN